MKIARKKPKRIKPPPGWEDRPDSFERFKSLASSLMAVSKRDLDREIANEEKRKRKRRAAA